MADDYDEFGKRIGDLLRGVLRGPPAPPEGVGAGEREPPSKFPPGGIDMIHHELRVEFDFGGKTTETVTLSGSMLIQRDEPWTNPKTGRREIQFRVQSWAATGWSEVLSSAVSYVLTPEEEQPLSTIEAEQDDGDFPASFNFNVMFDVRVNHRTVHKRIHGRPEGRHFRVVPPIGDRRLSPTITRFTDIGQVKVEHPAMGVITGKPVDCNDQDGKTVITIPGLRLLGRPQSPP